MQQGALCVPHEVFMYSLPESEVGGSATGLDGADARGGSDAWKSPEHKCSSGVRFAVTCVLDVARQLARGDTLVPFLLFPNPPVTAW